MIRPRSRHAFSSKRVIPTVEYDGGEFSELVYDERAAVPSPMQRNDMNTVLDRLVTLVTEMGSWKATRHTKDDQMNTIVMQQGLLEAIMRTKEARITAFEQELAAVCTALCYSVTVTRALVYLMLILVHLNPTQCVRSLYIGPRALR